MDDSSNDVDTIPSLNKLSNSVTSTFKPVSLNSPNNSLTRAHTFFFFSITLLTAFSNAALFDSGKPVVS